MTDNRRIVDDLLYAHFIMFSTDGRRFVLDHDVPKEIVLAVLNDQLLRFNAKCFGFVLMSNHVHAIVQFAETEQLSRFMHAWKRQSSFRIRDWCRRFAPHYAQAFEEKRRLWAPRYYSFELTQLEKVREKLTYMHENPVRAGMVAKATDWAWSSARWYELKKEVGVQLMLPI